MPSVPATQVSAYRPTSRLHSTLVRDPAGQPLQETVMNETIRLELEMDDEPLPIQEFGPAGLELQHEIDTWPRSFLFEFDADNEVTRTRMNWVRDRWGWNPGVFDLHVTLDDGSLVVSGVDERSLPGGR